MRLTAGIAPPPRKTRARTRHRFLCGARLIYGRLRSMSDQQPRYSAGQFGKYICTRCGWKWTPRPNSPDPPHACARCRSAYWQTPPVSSRANSPDNPKWQAERDVVARRKRERHMVRLRQLAKEFGLIPPPIDDRGVVVRVKDAPHPAPVAVDLRVRFNDTAPPKPASPPAAPAQPARPA